MRMFDDIKSAAKSIHYPEVSVSERDKSTQQGCGKERLDKKFSATAFSHTSEVAFMVQYVLRYVYIIISGFNKREVGLP